MALPLTTVAVEAVRVMRVTGGALQRSHIEPCRTMRVWKLAKLERHG